MSVNSDWELLFDHHNILDAIANDGHFMITSTQINAVHEARLMTKFDNRLNLPPVFSGNGLSILPTNRGGYIIGQFDAYILISPFLIIISKTAGVSLLSF